MGYLTDLIDLTFKTEEDLENFIDLDIPFCNTLRILIPKFLPISDLSLKEKVAYCITHSQINCTEEDALISFINAVNTLKAPIQNILPLDFSLILFR